MIFMSLISSNNKLAASAYTGDSSKGNPFNGPVKNAINMDLYEARTGNMAKSLPGIYTIGARLLAGHVPLKNGSNVLELGPRTGILTFQLLSKNPSIRLTGVDISDGNYELVNYKFNKSDGTAVKAALASYDNSDLQLLNGYWGAFRDKADLLSSQVRFVAGDFSSISSLEPKSFDAAVGAQYMHWMKLDAVFDKLSRVLKQNGSFVWNSASHFYNDSRYPAAQYGFRYHQFMFEALNEIAKTLPVADLADLSRPQHNLDSIQKISSKHGFDTKRVRAYLLKVKKEVFIKNHAPAIALDRVHAALGNQSDFDEGALEDIISDAISKVSRERRKECARWDETSNRFDIVPVFVSKKL